MKKSYKITAVLASVCLAAMLVGAFFINSSAFTESAEFDISANTLQSGGLPSDTLVARPKNLKGTLLSNSGVAPVETGIEKDAYDEILAGLLDEKNEISLSGLGLTTDELRDVMTAVLNSNPSLFYVDGRYTILYSGENIEAIRPTYKASSEELASMRTEYEKLVSEILSGVNPSWSSFEKVLFVHDYIVKSFEYDYTYSIHDSYGLLKNGKGVCQAYTLLCIELLGRLDIGVGAVPSVNMNHIWNCVELDGKWYHMDITWSDASASGNYDRFDDFSYDNFLCSDSAIAATGHHDWESDLVFSDDYDSSILKTLGRIKVSSLGEDWYLLVKDTNASQTGVSICLADFENNAYIKKQFVEAVWSVWDNPNSHYTEPFAGLGSYYDSLVISTADTLYGYNTSIGLVRLGEYTYQNGYIYGIKIKGSVATLRVTGDPGDYSEYTKEMLELSDITFDLEISYEDKGSNSIYQSYTGSIGWGKEFSVATPSVSGYLTDTSAVSGKMPMGGALISVAYNKLVTLRIDYVFADGSSAAESYIDSAVPVGKSYSVASPKIGGYYPSAQTVGGIMTEDGVTVTVIYRKDHFTLKIYYVYADQTPAAQTYETSGLAYMSSYLVISPTIDGYDPSISEVAGNINEDTEITVVYTRTRAAVKVSYLYPDGSLIEEKEIKVDIGAEFDIASPSVTGHTPELEALVGTATEKSYEFTVRYTANKYTLNIIYVYADQSTAAEPYTELVTYGESYSVTSPAIELYVPSAPSVSGTVSDSDISIVVVYRLKKFKVEFISEGEIFFAELIEYGSSVNLPDGVPQKDPSAQTVYTFKRWDGFDESLTVTENLVFTAVFEESVRKYKVVFQNHDGSVLYEDEVEYGGNAKYGGAVPERATEQGINYSFVGWDEDTEGVTSDMVFTAMFSDGMTQYTVSFYDANGKLLKSEKVYHGHSATPPSVPELYSDETYNYHFSAWIGKYKRVTSDTTVKASYNAVYIEYTVVFKDHNGSIISEQKLHYGDKVTIPADPVRKSDERYDYLFEKWTPEVLTEVKENAEYTAVYDIVSRFEFDAEDLADALASVKAAKTHSERFEALCEALKIRDGMYTLDPEAKDDLSELEREIEKYNAEINAVNAGFAKANESIASAMTLDASAMSALVIIWELLKKLVGIN